MSVLLAVVQRAHDDRQQQERQAADALEAARSGAAQGMQSQTEAHRQLCAEIEARMAADAIDAAATAAAAATAKEVTFELVLHSPEPATLSQQAECLHGLSSS